MLINGNKLRVERDEEVLIAYPFNKTIARHTFCRVRGVKPSYRPRSSPSGVSINVRCLDGKTIERMRITELDGERWEQAFASMHQDLNTCFEDQGS